MCPPFLVEIDTLPEITFGCFSLLPRTGPWETKKNDANLAPKTHTPVPGAVVGARNELKRSTRTPTQSRNEREEVGLGRAG